MTFKKIYDIEKYQAKILALIDEGENITSISHLLCLPTKSTERFVKARNWHLLPNYGSKKHHVQIKEQIEKSRAQILELLKQGITVVKIAKQFNIAEGNLYRYLKIQGIKAISHNQKKLADNRDYLISQLQQNRKIKSLAQELGVADLTLTRWLRKNKIKYGLWKKEQWKPKPRTHQSPQRSLMEQRLTEIKERIAGEETLKSIAKIIGVSTPTLNRYLRMKDIKYGHWRNNF